MIVARCIRTKIHFHDTFGQHVKGLLEDPKLLIACRDVPIPKLAVQDNPLLRPPNVEGLIGFIPLIAEEGVFLLCFYKSSVRIQSRLPLRMTSLEGSHKILIRPPEPLEMLVGRGNKSFARFPFHLFPTIMEGFEVAE